MGLAEKRIIKSYQEGQFQEHVKEINEIAGKEIDIVVDWDSLSNNEYSHLWEDSFTKIYFTPIIEALKSIAADDMGKEALNESLSKIDIKDANDIYSAGMAYSFSNSTLHVDHSPFSNVDQINERTEALTSLLEENM